MTITDVGVFLAQWDGVTVRRTMHHLVLLTEPYVCPETWEDVLRCTGLWGRDDYIYHYNPRLRREVFVFRCDGQLKVERSTSGSTCT